MEISTREVAGRVLVDMSGSFPRDPEEREAVSQRFCNALGSSKDFILVFHDVGPLTVVDNGVLGMWLRRAGVKMPALSGPVVSIVSDNERIRDIFTVVDSPIWAYPTEDEALAQK